MNEQFHAGDTDDRDKSKDFERLYVAHYIPLRDFIKRYVYSSSIADDLTQEVFVKVWQNRQNLDNILYLKTYIFSIAKNHTLDRLRTLSRQKESLTKMVQESDIQTNDIEGDLQSKEYLHFIEEVLTTIPTRSRKIFKMCREEGKSYAEVAEEIGVSKNAVKNHMVSTMKILKNAVADWFGIPLSIFFYTI